MRITCRTLFILLLVTVLIMAYCSTTADAKSVKNLLNRNRHPAKPAVRTTKYKYKVKTIRRGGHTKTKTKIKIHSGPKHRNPLSKLKKIAGGRG